MYILILGLLIFFGVHIVPSLVGIKTKIVAGMGEGPYKGLYSLISLAGLILIIYGKSQAAYLQIWVPPTGVKNIVILIMVISFYFLVAADMKSNIKRFTRHPMLLGITLWSGAHLLANGDLASILLFGSFFVFSIFAMISANIRGSTKQEKKYAYSKDVIAVIISIVAYLVFIKYLHPYLIGVAII